MKKRGKITLECAKCKKYQAPNQVPGNIISMFISKPSEHFSHPKWFSEY